MVGIEKWAASLTESRNLAMIRESNQISLAMPSETDACAPGLSPSAGLLPVPRPALPAVLIISLATFAVVCYLHFDDRVRAYQLMDDPVSYAKLEWYTGVLSNAVVLLWCASAAVCVFAGLLLWGAGDAHLQQLGRFFALFAAVNVWLMIDDLLLIHEQVARLLVGRASQHAGEGLEFALYAAIIAGGMWRFRTTIARTDSVLLTGAIVSLLASAAIDVGFQLELGGDNLFRETVLSVSWGPGLIDISEEILKLNGAMLWFVYFLRTGLSGASDVVSRRARELAA
jgi:hypothetical protein